MWQRAMMASGGGSELNPTLVMADYLNKLTSTQISVDLSKTYMIICSKNATNAGVQAHAWLLKDGTISDIGGGGSDSAVSISGTTLTVSKTGSASITYLIIQLD